MSYILYLDDIREPEDDTWVIARSFNEAVFLVQEQGAPKSIHFDHDLGCIPGTLYNAPTGYDFAKWLVEYDMDNNILTEQFTFNVHSANPIGAENIRQFLNNYLSNKKGTK